MSRPKCLRCGAGAEWIQGRVPDEAKDGGELAGSTGYLPRLSEALTWLHMRTRTLERIREIAPDSEVSRLAGQVLTCGPDGKTLCGMANAAMADNAKLTDAGAEPVAREREGA